MQEITPNEETQLIELKQLPVIQEQLEAVKAEIEKRTSFAKSQLVTEETRASVKALRSQLNKEFAALDEKRKTIKAQILKPYEDFEAVFKDCVTIPYKDADNTLREKITEVEDGLKAKKTEEVKAYYDEYAETKGVADIIPWERSDIKVNLTDTAKKLKETAKGLIDRVAAEAAAIRMMEDADEIMFEYSRTLTMASAVETVSRRKKEIEARKAMQAELEQRAAEMKAAEAKVDEAISIAPPTTGAPDPEAEPEEPIYTTKFTVRGTLAQLKALKAFLEDGGYDYE